MNTYIISYDLIESDNYLPLYEAIKSYYNWGRITESTWAIVTDQTATMVRDHLSLYMKPRDRIMVVKSAKVAAWSNVLANNDWVRDNI